MSMTLLNATNFIMRHQRYLLKNGEQDATVINDVQTSGNEGSTQYLHYTIIFLSYFILKIQLVANKNEIK